MPTSSLKWESIYNVPADERGSFWCWLNAKSSNRKILVPEGEKADELNCVEGYEYPLYDHWKSQVWKGKLIIPSHRYQDKSYTVFDCDAMENLSKEMEVVKANLISFMLQPYQHDKFVLHTGKIADWYNLEKELMSAHRMLLKNSNTSKLFFSLQGCARELTNLILGKYYKYKNSFK